MGAPVDRARTIPWGIEVERTRTLASHDPPAWLPETPFVVGVGRLAHDKGFDVLIEAHDRVRREIPHSLVIMGQGEERDALAALVARLGLEESVLLPGFVQNPFPVVTRASVLCGPSRHEGWGLMLAEALALGVPVIASDLAGPAAVLDGGRYGDLLEPGSVEAVASALARHLREPGRLGRKAQEASEHSSAFAMRRGAEQWVRLFEELSLN